MTGTWEGSLDGLSDELTEGASNEAFENEEWVFWDLFDEKGRELTLCFIGDRC